jgi:hypothetical protein
MVLVLILIVTFMDIIDGQTDRGKGNWSTQRKPPTCRKSLTNIITYKYISEYYINRTSNLIKVKPLNSLNKNIFLSILMRCPTCCIEYTSS